jgi:hypothetical protein
VARKSRARKGKTGRRARSAARPTRTKKTDKPDTLVAAGAEALALPVDAAWHAGVEFNLRLLYRHAALIDAFALPDETEPAPVFRA